VVAGAAETNREVPWMAAKTRVDKRDENMVGREGEGKVSMMYCLGYTSTLVVNERWWW